MKTIAKLRHLRISPRKVRLVTDLVKGLDTLRAQEQLKFSSKRAAQPVLKLLNSALANAQHNSGLEKDNLYIASILVDPGPSLKRWRARAYGRAAQILKRTSHVTLVLEEKIPSVSKKKISQKEEPIEEIKGKEEKAPTLRLEKSEVGIPTPKGVGTRAIPPTKPYGSTPSAKKRFFSRQTFGNAKKIFRRKSI